MPGCTGSAPSTTITLNGNKTCTATFTVADSDGDGVPNTTDLCAGTPPGTTVNASGCTDADGDTYSPLTQPADCNDTSADINPGATETLYNNIDENCDGLADKDGDNDGSTRRRPPAAPGLRRQQCEHQPRRDRGSVQQRRRRL